MELNEAVELIRPAVPEHAAVWVDAGAGSGLFSRALAQLLGSGGRVVAMDSDGAALEQLRLAPPAAEAAPIEIVRGDFQSDLAGLLAEVRPQGVLFANSLHFSPDAAGVLAAVAQGLSPGGRIVLVEYDRDRANPWVPHPLPVSRLPEIAPASAAFRVVGTRPSRYQGSMYCAVAELVGG